MVAAQAVERVEGVEREREVEKTVVRTVAPRHNLRRILHCFLRRSFVTRNARRTTERNGRRGCNDSPCSGCTREAEVLEMVAVEGATGAMGGRRQGVCSLRRTLHCFLLRLCATSSALHTTPNSRHRCCSDTRLLRSTCQEEGAVAVHVAGAAVDPPFARCRGCACVLVVPSEHVSVARACVVRDCVACVGGVGGVGGGCAVCAYVVCACAAVPDRYTEKCTAPPVRSGDFACSIPNLQPLGRDQVVQRDAARAIADALLRRTKVRSLSLIRCPFEEATAAAFPSNKGLAGRFLCAESNARWAPEQGECRRPIRHAQWTRTFEVATRASYHMQLSKM